MIGALISIVFALIVLGALWWAAQQLLGLIPMGEPFATIVRVLLVVIGVFIVLYVFAQLLGLAGVPVKSWRLS